MKPLTKNRAELLKLFFTNPDRNYYMQQIGRILDKKPGTFQRTLNNLVFEGILESEYRANARYFGVNKNYPLYNEVKNIVFKTVGIKGSLENILREVGNIESACIYGSYPMGKENYLSDIDLLVIGLPNEDKLVKKLDKLEEKLQREINYKLYTLKDVKKEINDEEPFILEILKNKKIMLIGDENELRKISKG
jgi:predicted nucleotidyltransferase